MHTVTHAEVLGLWLLREPLPPLLALLLVPQPPCDIVAKSHQEQLMEEEHLQLFSCTQSRSLKLGSPRDHLSLPCGGSWSLTRNKNDDSKHPGTGGEWRCLRHRFLDSNCFQTQHPSALPQSIILSPSFPPSLPLPPLLSLPPPIYMWVKVQTHVEDRRQP